MGGKKKSKNKKPDQCMGRSIMHKKLIGEQKVMTQIYSSLGDKIKERITKETSTLHKEPLDDFLDNQLVIDDLEVSRVFCKKQEVKERSFRKTKDTKIQEIVLPIPSRAIFITREAKGILRQKEKEEELEEEEMRRKQKKRKQRKKQVDFLMKGKHLIPMSNRVIHQEPTKKEEKKKEMKRKRLLLKLKQKENLNNENNKNLEEEETEEDEDEEENENEEDEEENENEEDEEEIENEEDEEENEKEEELESNIKLEDNESMEIEEQEKETLYDNDHDNDTNNTNINNRSLYNLKYIHMFERLGKKYEKLNIRDELNKEKIQKYEIEYFLEWRKLLSTIEEKEGYTVTPYEKNIEYWRQLWRVVEKSHILFYIMDARNPLFFYCKGFEHYVHKVDPRKRVFLILNKADFLRYEHRKEWSDYFKQRGVQIVFFSALRELYHQQEIILEGIKQECIQDSFEEKREDNDGFNKNISLEESSGTIEYSSEDMDIQESENEVVGIKSKNVISVGFGNLCYEEKKNDDTDILSVDELVELIKKTKEEIKNEYHEIEIGTFNETPRFMVGCVGYPNVGKSSIINSLIGKKKVGVSRKPGKTKHFQTILIKHDSKRNSEDICDVKPTFDSFSFFLCDCPGLVFPSLVFSPYDLILNGVFSIDHFKGNDFVKVVQAVCNLIPNEMCEFYKISKSLLRRKQINGVHREYLDAKQFLFTFCDNRKYISGGKGGVLNYNFATRLLIHDLIAGRLVYNILPSDMGMIHGLSENPSMEDESFIDYEQETSLKKEKKQKESRKVKACKGMDSSEGILSTKWRGKQLKNMMRGKKVVRCSID